MKHNNMDKLELLYDHYKETFSIIKKSIDQRNRFFVMVFVIMTLQFLFAASPESISSLIICIIKSAYEVDISNQMSIVQSFLWLILLYLTMRYYQTTVYIERQYKYIHSLEKNISDLGEIQFDREGGNYLLDYPKMNDFIDILYKWIFPIIYCSIICYKIINENMVLQVTLSIMLDTVLFFACYIVTILYLVFLHNHNIDS